MTIPVFSGRIVFNTRGLDVMAKFGNERNWSDYVREFPSLQNNLFGVWLYEAQWTYYGNVEGGCPHGHGRVVYGSGDCYEGKWKNGFMEQGRYVKSKIQGISMDSNWIFNGTFTTEGDCPDCPVEGIFDDGHNKLHVTCTEMKAIHESECWYMLKGLLDKKVADKEAKENGQIITDRWEKARPMIDQFKTKWIRGEYQELHTTIDYSPVVIFLCTGDDTIQSTYSDVRSTKGVIMKESRIVTTIPRVPIKIQVWLWCQEHLQAQMDSDKKKEVVYNTEERKIAELDLSSAQFEDGAGVRHTLQLNKARNPFSIVINLEFKLKNAG
jgi:hypothetical protein